MAPFQVIGERSFVEISKQDKQVCRRQGLCPANDLQRTKSSKPSSVCRDIDMQVRGLHRLAAYQAQ